MEHEVVRALFGRAMAQAREAKLLCDGTSASTARSFAPRPRTRASCPRTDRRPPRRTDCDDSSPSYGPGAIDRVAGLNGDGRPEVPITEGGTFCYGNTGQGYLVVTKLANGAWKRVTNGTGMAEFLNKKGAEGWPDLQVGGTKLLLPGATLERPGVQAAALSVRWQGL